MKLFRIYCGLDTNGQLPTEVARQTAERLALKFFPKGHTIYDAVKGRWMGEKVACTEETLVIEVMTSNARAVYCLAGAYKKQAKQESVMITEVEVNASFV